MKTMKCKPIIRVGDLACNNFKLSETTIAELIDSSYLHACNLVNHNEEDSYIWSKIKTMTIPEFFDYKGARRVKGMGRVKMRKIVRRLVFDAVISNEAREYVLNEWV